MTKSKEMSLQKFDKVLVALDNTDIDEDLINSASAVTAKTKSKQIYFVNVIKDVNIPAKIKKEFPNLIKDALNEREKEIKRKVDKFFSNENIKIKVDITNGDPTKTILRYSVKHDIDLIMMGRKNESNGGGVIVHRIARRAACSLLIIPRGFEREIKKILIPVDFSSPSLEAFNQAIAYTKDIPDVKIIAQNVYQVPSGFHYTGKTYKEFARIMAENVKSDFENFSARINDKQKHNITPIYTLDRHDDVISTIYQTAVKQKVDCIVISAMGRTSTTALFLGSKAEKLIALDSEIPLVVIRQKGKLEGILDYLKNL